MEPRTGPQEQPPTADLNGTPGAASNCIHVRWDKFMGWTLPANGGVFAIRTPVEFGWRWCPICQAELPKRDSHG